LRIATWLHSRGCLPPHPGGRTIRVVEATSSTLAEALTTTYTYDPENRLTQLASGSNVIGSYADDGAGDRYAKTVGGVTAVYTLDLASGLPQVLDEDDGTTVSRYVYGGGPRELDKGGTTYWYLPDTLGSVRLVTDSTGATPATYAYSAFGSTRKSTGTLSNEVRFTGERTDGESGLEFLRARTYDPSTGTFLQRDSWGITATNSQSIDAYVYTANNPVNATDPSGHVTLSCRYGREDCDSSAARGTQTVGQAGSSGYTDPVSSGQGSGGSPAMPPKPASQPQGRPDCGWNPACNLNNAIGTAGDWGRQGADAVNKGWQATGGAAVNWVHDNPALAATTAIVGATAVACVFTGVGCLALFGELGSGLHDDGRNRSWHRRWRPRRFACCLGLTPLGPDPIEQERRLRATPDRSAGCPTPHSICQASHVLPSMTAPPRV
jgi:RHS repeat-associated protein